LAQRDNFFNSLDRILKAAIAFGIILVSASLIILLASATYNLTNSLELPIAVIGCIVLVFGYLSWRIFGDL